MSECFYRYYNSTGCYLIDFGQFFFLFLFLFFFLVFCFCFFFACLFVFFSNSILTFFALHLAFSSNFSIYREKFEEGALKLARNPLPLY